MENLNKTGTPSRSEVIDVVFASRCECVMLNKGQYLLETVKFLDNFLCSMKGRQRKNQVSLRTLSTINLDLYLSTKRKGSKKGKLNN